jgi:hypothetical protein
MKLSDVTIAHVGNIAAKQFGERIQGDFISAYQAFMNLISQAGLDVALQNSRHPHAIFFFVIVL